MTNASFHTIEISRDAFEDYLYYVGYFELRTSKEGTQMLGYHNCRNFVNLRHEFLPDVIIGDSDDYDTPQYESVVILKKGGMEYGRLSSFVSTMGYLNTVIRIQIQKGK